MFTLKNRCPLSCPFSLRIPCRAGNRGSWKKLSRCDKGNVIDFVIHKNWDGNIMAGPPGEAWNNNLFEMISFARTNHRLIIRR